MDLYLNAIKIIDCFSGFILKVNLQVNLFLLENVLKVAIMK